MRLWLLLAAAVYAAPFDGSSLEKRADKEDYIIVFSKGLDTPDRVVRSLEDSIKGQGGQIHYEYRTVIKGFSVSMDPSAMERVKAMNDVDFPFVVEVDQQARTML